MEIVIPLATVFKLPSPKITLNSKVHPTRSYRHSSVYSYSVCEMYVCTQCNANITCSCIVIFYIINYYYIHNVQTTHKLGPGDNLVLSGIILRYT